MTTPYKWFAIKTLYKITALGKPKKKDTFYDDSKVLVEERTVLFKAKNEEEAMEKAVKEASEYADSVECKNAYDQKVTATLLKGLDMFELFDKPENGVEVFNDTQIMNKKMTDDQLIEARFSQEESEEDFKARKRFVKKELAEVIY